MDLNKLKIDIEICLKKPLPSRIFLDSLRMLDEDSRQSAAYNDPNYLPFYYWLGKEIQPKNVLVIGFRLGLCSGCFLKGCSTVENFVGFQQKTNEFWSPRLGKANIKKFYKGIPNIYHGNWNDDSWQQLLSLYKWDLTIIDEEVGYDQHKVFLDAVWLNMRENGLIIVDYVTRHIPVKQAYIDFCKSVNRPETIIKTRYGVGMVQK